MPRDELRRLAKQLNKKQKPTIRPERATLVRIGDDGTAYVHFDGGVDETPAIMAMDANIGDTVTVWRSGGRCIINGNTTSPADVAKPMAIRAQRAAVNAQVKANTTAQELEAEKARIGHLEADSAEITELVAQKATIADLQAAEGRISDLESDHVSTTDLTAVNGEIDNLKAKDVTIEGNITAATGRIGTIEADYLKAADMQAETARVDNLLAKKATVNDLNAATGRISVLESTKANISDLEANYITADDIEATYMHADMSNSDVAWIQNGVIANGAISSAMINDVSANKLTAGTINGSVINVTNLNADNITTGTINGQRIGEGSLSLDKLSEDVYTEAEVDAKLSTMQSQIDGAIETWTGTDVPTLNNAPASAWTTAADRDKHVGDVYFNTTTGYNYRFTKSGSTYSWLQIKDTDITNALQRIQTAEGQITQFDSDISTLKTDTGELKTKTQSLETSLGDKVDTTTFNELEDTVDGHSQTISQHTTAISNKADTSTVNQVTNRVTKAEQDISGINTTIGELQATVEGKADGSTVTTISNKLNTVSDTVDGHTQTLSSVQSTLSTKADNSTVSTLRSEYNETKTTVSGHETRLTATESVANGVRADFDNLEIGGRNLLRGSAVLGAMGTTHGWFHNGGTPSLDTVDGIECIKVVSTTASALIASARTASRVNLEWGQTYIASCWLMFNEDINNNFGDNTPLHFHAGSVATTNVFDLAIRSHGGGVTTYEVEPDESYGNTIPANTWVRFVRKIVTADSAPNADYPYPVFAPLIYGPLRKATTSDEHITWIRGFKVERGTVPTAWTPAPEDLETEVTTLKTDYAAYKQTTTENLSTLGTTVQGIDGRVTTAESTIQQHATDIEAKVSKDGVIAAINLSTETEGGSTAKISADKVEIDGTAIFSAISDDVDNAITDKGYQTASQVNSAITSKGYQTSSQVESAITSKGYATTGQAQEYASTAESNAKADTASKLTSYSTTSQMNTAIGDAVDAIEVGGRNLLRGTSTFTNYEGDMVSMSSSPVSGGYGGSASHIKSKNAWTGVGIALHKVLQRVGAKIGDTITMSIWVSTDSETEVAHNIYLYRAKSGSSTPGINNPGGTNLSTTITLVKGQWQRAYVTFDVTDYALNTVKTTRFETNKASADYSLFWAAPKIEFGNKPTDWTPAPEDTDAAISAAQATADAAAPKADAIARTQRIWYRQTADGSKPSVNETWLATSGTGYGNWSLTVPQLTNGSTKYPKLYTAVQSQTVAQQAAGGTCSCSPVQLDDSTTVIDGGNIITGSVAANKLEVYDATIQKIRADAIDTSSIAIGQGQVTGLTNALAGKQPTGDYATKAQAQGYADAKDTAIADAAKTATNYITEITGGGVSVHDASDSSDYVQITASGMDVYNDGVNVARFGADGAQIGKNDSSRLELGAASLRAYDADGNMYFNMTPDGLTADQIDVNDDLRRALLQVTSLIIGSTEETYISANGNHMGFINGGNEVAYIDVDPNTNEAVFYMTRSIVVKDMQFGEGKWKWYKRDNNNMSLKWLGGM